MIDRFNDEVEFLTGLFQPCKVQVVCSICGMFVAACGHALWWISLHIPSAFLPWGEEETVPSRPGRPHSENLSWMEVPHLLPAAEEESDSGGSLVPSICGEALYRHGCGSVLFAENYKRALKSSTIFCREDVRKLSFYHKTTSAFDHHCSCTLTATNKIPEDQARHHRGAVLHQRVAGEQLPPNRHNVQLRDKKPVLRGFYVSCSTRPANSWESWNTTRGVKRQRPPSQLTGMAHRYWSHGGRCWL